MRALPAEVQTLYAELVERLTAFEASRSIWHVPGSFATKDVKGQRYVYFQHSLPGGRTKQVYLGRETPELKRVVARFATARSDVEADRSDIERLCAELRAGGISRIDHASSRVLATLANAGVFRLGGVLVGTHAFIAIGNMLGVKWEHGLLRTEDVDIASERSLAVGLPDITADVPGALEALGMGFLPVPGLSLREPSTSFKVRGQPLRVDLLTPLRGRPRGPVAIPRFGAAAEPVALLDYLIAAPQSAAIVDSGGILVQVPDPARFALHKLLVATRRVPALQSKREKDLRQAAELIAFLVAERPGDLAAARTDLERRGPNWRRRLTEGLSLLKRRAPAVVEHLPSRAWRS